MKVIFVGSSKEGLGQAKSIAAVLKGIPRARPLLWTDAFVNGDITFLRVEEVAREVAGAIFLATPDDRSTIRGRKVAVPRANVLFEYGYITASLGRRRVALCRYTDVELPSDFEGLTHIPMGRFVRRSYKIDHHAKSNLKAWSAALPDLPTGFSAATRLHGYSGTWAISVDYSLWRGIRVSRKESVEVHGRMVLHMPCDGVWGSGAACGDLRVNVGGCYAEFRLNDVIVEATVDSHGRLDLISETQTRQRVSMEGKAPQVDGFEQVLRSTRRFHWLLEPVPGSPAELRGIYTSEKAGVIVSSGIIIAKLISQG